MRNIPIIGITLGDVAGVGPEVVLKAINCPKITQLCEPLIIGDYLILKKCAKAMKLSIPSKCNILDLQLFRSEKEIPSWGTVRKKSGVAAVEYIKKAVSLALEKKIDAIVTAPISKKAIQLAGFKYPGHTEFIARLTHTKEYAMMFVADKLKVILVTTHIELKKVAKVITLKKVYTAIKLAKIGGELFKIKNPKIAVLGLNPHAGENGLLGSEEKKKIAPAIELAKKEKINVFGPISADIAFWQAINRNFDIVIAMYHDQGLIPIKTLAFEKTVNITIGLPIIRTSPAHGTAFDIAGKGIANPSSMIEAIKIAVQLVKNQL